MCNVDRCKKKCDVGLCFSKEKHKAKRKIWQSLKNILDMKMFRTFRFVPRDISANKFKNKSKESKENNKRHN